jgi:isopentenyl-diphosphate Delta-isomerase
MDELIDICDSKNNLTNVSKMKSEAHEKGLYHRSAHIWIYNSKGELLIQLRAKDKMIFPDMWDVSVAGHIGASEDPIISALREIKEEIGLSIEEKDLGFFKIIKEEIKCNNLMENEFHYVYFLKFDGDINQLKLQEEELQSIKFVGLDELEQELKNNSNNYAPHGKYWFDMIKCIRENLN